MIDIYIFRSVRLTYKKNFGSPLHTALSRASLSAVVFGIGLQNASESSQLTCVR